MAWIASGSNGRSDCLPCDCDRGLEFCVNRSDGLAVKHVLRECVRSSDDGFGERPKEQQNEQRAEQHPLRSTRRRGNQARGVNRDAGRRGTLVDDRAERL